MHIALDGYVILGLIAILMVTLLVFEGAGLSAGLLEKGYTPPPIAGAVLSAVFKGEISAVVFYYAWWLHVVTVLAFAAYLPQSKHLHIVTTLPNVFFRKRDKKERFCEKPGPANGALASQSEPPAIVLDEPSCYHFRVLDPGLPLDSVPDNSS